MGTPIRIVLADDHAVLRQGIAELLSSQADLQVVGEAVDGQQAVELARALQPDVVVMDMQMPGMSGFEATRRIRAAQPAVRIVILSAFNDEQYVYAAIQAGASGYLIKTAPISRLEDAVRRAHGGQLDIELPEHREAGLDFPRLTAFSESAADAERAPAAVVPRKPLSPRECEVLRMLARGCNNREISEMLHISGHTVEAHVSHILSKLGVASRLGAVVAAVRAGLLSVDS
jgi:DNA-binding NarL/FixJ family response regulator